MKHNTKVHNTLRYMTTLLLGTTLLLSACGSTNSPNTTKSLEEELKAIIAGIKDEEVSERVFFYTEVTYTGTTLEEQRKVLLDSLLNLNSSQYGSLRNRHEKLKKTQGILQAYLKFHDKKAGEDAIEKAVNTINNIDEWCVIAKMLGYKDPSIKDWRARQDIAKAKEWVSNDLKTDKAYKNLATDILNEVAISVSIIDVLLKHAT